MEAVNDASEADKGGFPPPSPLTGCYLLIVIGEPHCNEHKDIILQKVAKGLLSWDVNDCLVDLEKELAVIAEQGLEGEEARYGERLIQFASENLVTEILIQPVVSTLVQCVRNLLSSFTRHRHIIHAGYTLANNGSWVLQDGTFSLADFSEAFQENDVLRVIRAYENGISLHIHCAPEGDWTRLPKESFTKSCKLRVNPTDVLTAGSPCIATFINYLQPFLIPAELGSILESSDVVGNIRFSRPTLYVFPGGQGDAALFGINGFNMLLDGGFSRKACFWDFVRHLDRLDAVLLTRLNNSNVNGISAVLKRKAQNAVYPQIGHFFCNIQERKAILSPDGDKDKDPLLINLLEEGHEIVSNLRHLGLSPQVCYRDSEPVNLYHKVGHGTLDMYVLSPAKDSKEVREFLQRWNNNDQKMFANQKTIKDFAFPLQNLVSICALLVWQPANPEDTITRILFPGSSPQVKIFEGLDKIKNLEFIKHPVCSEKSLTPVSFIKSKQAMLDKILPAEKKIPMDNKKAAKSDEIEVRNGIIPNSEKIVKKSDSTESEKSVAKLKKVMENGDKPKPKPKIDTKAKPRSTSQQRKIRQDKKPSPTTPKKVADKMNNDTAKPVQKASPSATPAKSTKEANNRKVLESKAKLVPKPEKKEAKTERKPISRRPNNGLKLSASPQKKVNGVQKPDIILKRNKLDKEGTTDSSTVSTPSADQDSILKKDISKLSPEEIQNLKAQELADLKEEQEAVKEIEAVFRKSEQHSDQKADFRKIQSFSIDDKLESEEYLIIEKTEIEQDLSNEAKEDETQKMARDSEESEKKRKLSDEIVTDVEKITTSIVNIIKVKDEVIEVSATSLEEKNDVSTDKKDIENEIKEPAPESLPGDEKGSTNIESGATTTAPTLPEDERIPLDEIKESEQIIEEKHVKEDTKEKVVPVLELPSKTFENVSKLPPVVGIRLDKHINIRDIVKTPDEVADLPVHEEVDMDNYNTYNVEGKSDDKEQQFDNKGRKENGEEVANKVKTDAELMTNVVKEVKSEENQLVLDEDKNKDTAVIIQDLNQKELSKSPDEEKDTDEHELEMQKGNVKEDTDLKTKDDSNKDSDIKAKEITKEATSETPLNKDESEDKEPKTLVKPVETTVIKEAIKKTEATEEIRDEVVLFDKQEFKPETAVLDENNAKEAEKIEHEVDSKATLSPQVEIVQSDKAKTIVDEGDAKTTVEEIQAEPTKESIEHDILHNLPEVPKEDILIAPTESKQLTEDAKQAEEICEKLEMLKATEDQHITVISEVVKVQHAEPVIITSDSNPESPMVERPEIGEDRLELGRKSPKEREEDVIKIVASVAEVLKSDAPLEEFKGKIPYTIPYKGYTTELRETHITTVDSPLEEQKNIAQSIISGTFIEKEREISAILEEVEPQETKLTKMIKESEELMKATSKIISDIKHPRLDEKDEEDEENKDEDIGVVHRMLVTASSEDGGEETEICPPGTIIFSKSSESSGRSSPDPQSSQKASQISSLADSDGTTVIGKSNKEVLDKEKFEPETKMENAVIEPETEKLDKTSTSEIKDEKTEDKESVEETFEKKEETKETATKSSESIADGHLESVAKDLEKLVAEPLETTKEDDPKKTLPDPNESKYNLFNGLETVEKMLVDVIIPERQETPEPEEYLRKSSISSTKTENVDEKIQGSLSKESEDLQDDIEIKTDQTTCDKVLEDSGKDLQEAYDTNIEMAKSIVFDKCAENHENQISDAIKVLEQSGQDLQETYEANLDIAKSIVFDKCLEQTEQTENNIVVLKTETEDISGKSISEPKTDIDFKKSVIEGVDDNESALKNLDEKSIPDATQASELGKTSPDPKNDQKDTVALMDSNKTDSRKSSIDIKENITEIISDSNISKSGKVTPDIKENGKDSISPLATDLKELSSSGKTTPDLKQEESVPELDSHKMDSRKSSVDVKESISESIILKSGKTTPDLKEDRKDSISPLATDLKEISSSGKTTPDLKQEESVPELDSHKMDSRKSSVDVKESVAESIILKSGKTTPDLKEDRKDSISSLATTTDLKETSSSGKISPDLKKEQTVPELDSNKIDSRKSSVDVKESIAESTILKSGKTTPDLKEDRKDSISSLATATDLKETSSSGKISPDLKKEETVLELDSNKMDSRKSSVDVKESIAESTILKSGKTTPDLKEVRKDSISSLATATDLKEISSSGKISPDLKQEDPVTELDSKKMDSRKSSVDGKENIAESTILKSGKTTPDLKEDRKDSIASLTTATDLKETSSSGKTSPDLKEKESVPELDSNKMVSGESSVDVKESIAESTILKSGKTSPDLKEDRKDSISSIATATDLREISSSGKTTPDLKQEDPVPELDSNKMDSRKSSVDVRENIAESITLKSGKTTPDLKEVIKDSTSSLATATDLKETLSGKSTPDLKHEEQESISSNKVDSRKASVIEIVTETKPDSIDLKSGKVTPDKKDDRKDSISTIATDLKELSTSGKTTPDLKDDKQESVVSLDKMDSRKSSVDIKESITDLKSGKTTPDLKEEKKDSILSSTAVTDLKETSSSGKTTPDLKDETSVPKFDSIKVDSRKSSIDINERVTELVEDSVLLKSGKATPETKEDIKDSGSPILTSTDLKELSSSGKTTPDFKDDHSKLDLNKVESRKSSIDIKETIIETKQLESEKETDRKDSVSSLPAATDLKESSSSDEKDKDKDSEVIEVISKSGKVSPDVKDLGTLTELKETSASGKTTPDVKDLSKQSAELLDSNKIDSLIDTKEIIFESTIPGKITSEVKNDKEDSITSLITATDLKETLSSGKTTPDVKDEQKGSDALLNANKIDSRKSSVDIPETSIETTQVLKSGKTTPEVKDDRKDSVTFVATSKEISGKITPELKDEQKDSRKSSIDIKEQIRTSEETLLLKSESSTLKQVASTTVITDHEGSAKLDEKLDSSKTEFSEKITSDNTDLDCLTIEKSSPSLSGKSSPETKEENRDSVLSGKSSPIDLKDLDDKQLDASFKSDSVLSLGEKDKSDIDEASSPSPIVDDKSKTASVLSKGTEIQMDTEKQESVSVVSSKVDSEVIEEKLSEVVDMTQSIVIDKDSTMETKTTTLTDILQSIKDEKADSHLIPEPEEPEKISISDVEISFTKSSESVDKTASAMTASFLEHEISISGPSTSAKEPTDDLSGKATPDIADVELEETHIRGSSTPPTVPVSPIIKDTSSDEAKTPIKTVITSLKEAGIRSYTPASDDYDIGASTYSDISSGEASRAPQRCESDEDEPGSPLSVTSQVAHSRSSSRYDFDDERIGTKLDPMSTSFYGALPDDESSDLEYEKALQEHRLSRGEDLVATGEASSTYLYEVTKAKFASTSGGEDAPTSQPDDVMTASFIGDLPSGGAKKDLFDSWGKPLGLPSPAPLDNRGTPKKERKLPSNVSAKNKLNDDKKRSESPSKYKNKKLSPVYVDLTYVPHHGNGYYSYVDFFKRVRARYYVFSGIEPSREVYNALLEAKQTWDDKELEVTIIPTYDTDILGYWVAENEELLSKFKIDLSPSASRCTINLQDHETSCSAYRLEF